MYEEKSVDMSKYVVRLWHFLRDDVQIYKHRAFIHLFMHNALVGGLVHIRASCSIYITKRYLEECLV